MSRLLFSLLFLSASVRSMASLAEEQLILKSAAGNETEEEGSGEESEQVLISENSTSSDTSSVQTTTVTSLLTSTYPSKPVRCYDISKKCKKIQKLCDREEYRTIMVRQCAWTCKACDEFSRLPQHSRCRDSYHRYLNKKWIKVRKCF